MAQEQEKTKNSKERSVAYPSITLGDAVEYTLKLREALGKGPYSRDEAARALGHAKLSGPAARKVAALVHYALLERTGNTYNQTQLVQDILKPLSDEQKNQAIVKAARSPRLFEKLLQKYSGQALPTMLQNVLIREGVSESAADEVVKLFTESIKFAGLLINGIVVQMPAGDEEIVAGANPDSTPVAPSKVPEIKPGQRNNAIVSSSDDFVFDFNGGIKLIVPKNTKTSEAIADGELKPVRQALTKFANDFMVESPAGKEEPEGNDKI